MKSYKLKIVIILILWSVISIVAYPLIRILNISYDAGGIDGLIWWTLSILNWPHQLFVDFFVFDIFHLTEKTKSILSYVLGLMLIWSFPLIWNVILRRK